VLPPFCMGGRQWVYILKKRITAPLCAHNSKRNSHGASRSRASCAAPSEAHLQEVPPRSSEERLSRLRRQRILQTWSSEDPLSRLRGQRFMRARPSEGQVSRMRRQRFL